MLEPVIEGALPNFERGNLASRAMTPNRRCKHTTAKFRIDAPPSCSFLSAVSLLPIEQIVDPNRQHLEVTIADGEDVAGGEMQRSNRNGKGRVV
jgi:hypothetical protein